MNKNITTNSYERKGVLVVEQPMPIKGISFEVNGQKVLTVNSRLPRSERKKLIANIVG